MRVYGVLKLNMAKLLLLHLVMHTGHILVLGAHNYAKKIIIFFSGKMLCVIKQIKKETKDVELDNMLCFFYFKHDKCI